MAKLYTNILIPSIMGIGIFVNGGAHASSYGSLVDHTRKVPSCRLLFQNMSNQILPDNASLTPAFSGSSVWQARANDLESTNSSNLSKKKREKIFELAFKQILEKIETRIRWNSDKLQPEYLQWNLTLLKDPEFFDKFLDNVANEISRDLDTLISLEFNFDSPQEGIFYKQVLNAAHIDRPTLKLMILNLAPLFVRSNHLDFLEEKYSIDSLPNKEKVNRRLLDVGNWVSWQMFAGATLAQLPGLELLGGAAIVSAPFVNGITIAALPLAYTKTRGFFQLKIPKLVNTHILKRQLVKVHKRMTLETVNYVEDLNRATNIRKATLTQIQFQAGHIVDSIDGIHDYQSFSEAYSKLGNLVEDISCKILSEALIPPSQWSKIEKILKSIVELKNHGSRATGLSSEDQLLIHRDVLDLELRIEEMESVSRALGGIQLGYDKFAKKLSELVAANHSDSRDFIEFVNSDFKVGKITLLAQIDSIYHVKNMLSFQQDSLKMLGTINNINNISDAIRTQLDQFIVGRKEQIEFTRKLFGQRESH